MEREADGADGPVAVLGDDHVCRAPLRTVFLIPLFFRKRAIEEHDDVSVLLDGARFAQIGEDGALTLARFDRAGELRERDDGHVHLFRENLEATRDLGDLDLAGFRALVLRLHELQVVDDNEPLVRFHVAQLPARLGADLENRRAGRVVNPEIELGEPIRSNPARSSDRSASSWS